VRPLATPRPAATRASESLNCWVTLKALLPPAAIAINLTLRKCCVLALCLIAR
jgi:hypothetical protein